MMTSIYKEKLQDELKILSEIPIEDIDPESVVDLSKIKINQTLPPEERVRSLLQQVGNPYVYRCGDVVIKVSFTNNGKTFQSCMEEYLATELRNIS